MSRLVIRNSSLVHPPVPEDILREDDIILPLVDRFDETMFMAGPGYDEVRSLFPAFSLHVRKLAREIGRYLPAWMGEPVAGLGHSVWDAYADQFTNFSLGPLHVHALLTRHAASLEPEEVLGWELSSTPGWWAGRQMVAEVAEAVAQACGAPWRASGSDLKRVFRDAVLPSIRSGQAVNYLRHMLKVDLAEPEGPTDVLFVVAGSTLVPMYDRLAARLQSEFGLHAMALETPMGGPTTEISGGRLPRWNLYCYSEPWLAKNAMAGALAAERSFDEVSEGLRTLPASEDLPPPLGSALKRRLHSTVMSELPVAWYTAHVWRNALDALRPKVLVSFNAYNEALAPAVLQARHRGIPTVMLQHGVFGPFFRAGAILPHDEVAVFGAYAREMLSAIAAPHTSFVETGHVSFDDLRVEPELEATAAKLRGVLLDGCDYLVVATTQPVEGRLKQNEARWWLELLAEACRGVNAKLAIKPHPHEKDMLREYRDLATRAPETVRFVQHGEIPLSHLIAASDLLVTRFSTTAVEAALLNKPVLIANIAGGPDQYPYVDEGVAVGVYSPEEMSPVVERVLSDPDTRRKLLARQGPFLDRHLGPRDGKATERVADLISRHVRECTTPQEE